MQRIIKKNIYLSDLIFDMFQKGGLKEINPADAVTSFIDILIEQIQSGSNIKIDNFGTFVLNKKTGFLSNNFKRDNKCMVKTRLALTFKPAKPLIKQLNS